MKRRERMALLAACGLLAAGFAALGLGLSTGDEGLRILWRVRVPEGLTAALVGGALGLSGLLFQTSLRNPLADPFILGVAGGAALGSVVVTLFDPAGSGLGPLALLRAAAAFGVGYLVLLALLRGFRGWVYALLLGGVVANTLCAALARVLTMWLSPGQVAQVTTFLIGYIPTPPLWVPGLLALLVAGSFLLTAGRHRSLDLLLLSSEEAASLGLAVPKFRGEILALATLLAAACVSIAGMIGFVGLVAPHAARLCGARAHRTLIPLSFLAGACILLWAHDAGKHLAGSLFLPAGVLTTLAGAPFFLWLLLRRRARADAGEGMGEP